MTGGIVPLLLISAAVGLALTFASDKAAWIGLAAMAAVATAISFLPLPSEVGSPILAGLLLSAIATAALVFLPGRLRQGWATAVAINGGAWLGAAAAASETRASIVAALPLALLFIPGKLLAAQEHGIATKVVSSWLIAVASLSMFVSLVPTPGYEPDHME